MAKSGCKLNIRWDIVKTPEVGHLEPRPEMGLLNIFTVDFNVRLWFEIDTLYCSKSTVLYYFKEGTVE